MKNIIINRTTGYLFCALCVIINYSCAPDEDNLEEATFPSIANIFIDGFSAGLQYDAFGDSKVTAFDVDTDITFEGSSSMRFDIPNGSDPQGGYAGGIFSTELARDLSSYNVLTFYARASRGETIDQIGFGLTFNGEVYRTQVNNLPVGTAWQKFFIPIPDASKLTEENGMFWYAEAADDGESYQLWIDEVKFENLNTIIPDSAEILNGFDQEVEPTSGNTITINGTSATYNLPTGTLQNVITTAAFFDFTSSNESLATVNDLGVVTVLSDDGEGSITATLNEIPADGSIQFVDDDDDNNSDNLLENGDFENGMTAWEGNGFNVQTEGGNSFNFVNVATPGNPFDVNLSQRGLDITEGESYTLTFDASTDSATGTRTMLAGLGLSMEPFTNTTAEVELTDEIQTFTVELVANFSSDDGRVLFDMGADTGIVVIDNVILSSEDDEPDGDFDDGLLSNGDFEDGPTVWEGNGFNVQTEGGNSFNFVDVETAGNPFDVNLSQRGLTITEGETYTLTFEASTDPTTGSRTMIAGIGLFVEPFTNQTNEVTLTDTPQTFSLELVANFSSTDGRVLFDMGADTGIVVIDNVSLELDEEDPDGGFDDGLLENGDFEDGDNFWTGNALNVLEDGGNSFNFANVETAGDAFSVNLSQTGLAISEGQTYTLSFDASTDADTGSRTMIAGIGLFVDPFTNQSMEVTLTSTLQTFTLELTANFSSTDGRVLFDMGADTGVVVIDNVSLMLN